MASMPKREVAVPAGAERLLNVYEVAARLRVSSRQVWKLAAAGQIPQPLKLARSARWRASDIDRFIADGCSMAGDLEPMTTPS